MARLHSLTRRRCTQGLSRNGGITHTLASLALSLLAMTVALSPLRAADSTVRSPVNQVFQFMYTGECKNWPDGATTTSIAYLWIPEKCEKVRGAIIMCTNVPEHMLVGHPAIRKACEDNHLALVWCVPTFWRFGKTVAGDPVPKGPEIDKIEADFLQQLLDGLAAQSGYSELSTVPWLPMGESGHLLMVMGLVNTYPERCIAGICMKNPGSVPRDKSVPMLWTLGTGEEWGQTKSDLRTAWNDNGKISDMVQNWAKNVTNLKWPLSIAVEAGTGHFYCTDQMAELFHTYINAACQARLSDDGSATLKPIKLENGVVAYLPFTGSEDLTPTAYSATIQDRPWFFDAATAKAAQDVSKANWSASTQLPALTEGTSITVTPYTLNSVTQIKVSTDSEFSVKPFLADKIPDGFISAGEALANTPGTPVAEWICGQFAPLGDNKFKIALDRTYKHGANYIILRKDGDANVHFAVQPIHTTLVENTGKNQQITFDPIPDVPDGTATVQISAKSDSGLPVSFFVQAGPATVDGDKITLTKIPPSAKYPVEVTVCAWQWGKPDEVKTATIVKQTFHVTK